MSRLTDLIAQTKAKDPTLGEELEREVKALRNRRAFGLNFERHAPETVELPGRPVRRGDKVRITAGESASQRVWRVLSVERAQASKRASEQASKRASEQASNDSPAGLRRHP